MRKVLFMALLALSTTMNAQWTSKAGGSDFDGKYKTASVQGVGKDYPYTKPALVVNKFDQSGINFYISGAGYFSERSNVSIKWKFDGDDTIYTTYDFNHSPDNKILFLKSFHGGMLTQIDFIHKLQQHSTVSVRISNDHGANDMKFSLTGSTKALNFVLGDISAMVEKSMMMKEMIKEMTMGLNLKDVDRVITAIVEKANGYDSSVTKVFTKPGYNGGAMYKRYGYVDVYIMLEDGTESKVDGIFSEVR